MTTDAAPDRPDRPEPAPVPKVRRKPNGRPWRPRRPANVFGPGAALAANIAKLRKAEAARDETAS